MGEQLQSPGAQPESLSVSIGSVLEIHYEGDPEGENETVQIVGWNNKGGTGEGRPIPDTSELGDALIKNAAPGATVRFTGPTGEDLAVFIISVR